MKLSLTDALSAAESGFFGYEIVVIVGEDRFLAALGWPRVKADSPGGVVRLENPELRALELEVQEPALVGKKLLRINGPLLSKGRVTKLLKLLAEANVGKIAVRVFWVAETASRDAMQVLEQAGESAALIAGLTSPRRDFVRALSLHCGLTLEESAIDAVVGSELQPIRMYTEFRRLGETTVGSMNKATLSASLGISGRPNSLAATMSAVFSRDSDRIVSAMSAYLASGRSAVTLALALVRMTFALILAKSASSGASSDSGLTPELEDLAVSRAMAMIVLSTERRYTAEDALEAHCRSLGLVPMAKFHPERLITGVVKVFSAKGEAT